MLGFVQWFRAAAAQENPNGHYYMGTDHISHSNTMGRIVTDSDILCTARSCLRLCVESGLINVGVSSWKPHSVGLYSPWFYVGLIHDCVAWCVRVDARVWAVDTTGLQGRD